MPASHCTVWCRLPWILFVSCEAKSIFEFYRFPSSRIFIHQLQVVNLMFVTIFPTDFPSPLIGHLFMKLFICTQTRWHMCAWLVFPEPTDCLYHFAPTFRANFKISSCSWWASLRMSSVRYWITFDNSNFFWSKYFIRRWRMLEMRRSIYWGAKLSGPQEIAKNHRYTYEEYRVEWCNGTMLCSDNFDKFLFGCHYSLWGVHRFNYGGG